MLKPAYRQGLADPEAVLRIWKKEFEGAHRESGFYLLTLHPQITGRYYRLEVLRSLIDDIRTYPGVWFATHAEVARAFREIPDGMSVDIRSGKSRPQRGRVGGL